MRLKKPVETICPECQKTFKAFKSDTVYCSGVCYKRMYRRENKYVLAEKRIAKARLVLVES